MPASSSRSQIENRQSGSSPETHFFLTHRADAAKPKGAGGKKSMLRNRSYTLSTKRRIRGSPGSEDHNPLPTSTRKFQGCSSPGRYSGPAKKIIGLKVGFRSRENMELNGRLAE